MINFSKIAEISGGKTIVFHQDVEITALIYDSRKIILNEGAVFFAINGTRHDGHKYIKELYNKGIRNFIVEKEHPHTYKNLPKANVLLVKDTVKCLQEVSAYHRKQFELPVIAITGSNGKTIVKEWLSQLLSSKFNVVKSPKSYNSQLGVPLSVWQMAQTHEIAIFEAGISQPGEMENLQEVLKPTIGIFTNIGTAHDEGFENWEQKVNEKAKLFRGCSIVIYCKDHKLIDQELNEKYASVSRLFTWSFNHPTADILITSLEKSQSGSVISLNFNDVFLHFNLPFNDDASLENCMHCISFLLYEGFPPADIQMQLNELNRISMRLELKQGVDDCYIIDDSYNNDLAGLRIALEFMNQQKQKEKRTLILSDILQSGIDEKILYKDVARLIESKGIDKIIGIGPSITKYGELFNLRKEFFSDTASFLRQAKRFNFQNEMVLIKGARIFRFEQIVNQLQAKIHGTVLEIDLNALIHNLNFYRSQLHENTKIMVMVKAFAYGSGSFEIAHLLQYHRVDYLAVAYTDEGVALRKHGIKLPIMVMNPSPDTFSKLIECHLEPEVYSLKILHSFQDFLIQNDKHSKIHIKIDTGMHRLGFIQEDLPELIRIVKNNKRFEIVSIFSHLAGADNQIFNDYSHYQAENFKLMSDNLIEKLEINPIRHFLNSAGIIRFPEYRFDMVRLGIGLYGVEVNELHQEKLQSISTLKTIVSQIKNIRKGESVGYSRKGIAEKDSKIATISIGYADGYDRRFGNGRGQVLINGKLASTIGNICMDMTMVDITGIEAKEGDEVVIFGKDLPITELAKIAETIPYEILTNIGERVKRVFYSE
jgi:Alr-MurF fusion protein